MTVSVFDSLKRLFRRSPGAARPREPGSSDSDPALDNVRVISPGANPFGVELWDCTEFTQSRRSMTSDPAVAARFASLRAADGKEYRNRLPREASSLSCSLRYPLPSRFSEGPLFKAETMEDKWDVYLFEPHLYFVRSWTGDLEHRAAVEPGDGELAVTQIEAAAGRDGEFSRRAVDYLIKSHIFGVLVPHPLPPELPAEPMQVAAYSFSLFGRRCALATYADTTMVPWTHSASSPRQMSHAIRKNSTSATSK